MKIQKMDFMKTIRNSLELGFYSFICCCNLLFNFQRCKDIVYMF
jgi:hypothetical protein